MLDKIGFAENFEMLYFVFCFFKGDGGLKILQKEIGGIQICVEIFQKNFLNAFLGVHSYIMN